jgi:hypothetical protein
LAVSLATASFCAAVKIGFRPRLLNRFSMPLF